MFDKIFDSIEDLQLPKSRQFHINTKIHDNQPVKKTDPATWPEAWRKIQYKAYPRLDQVILPKPSKRKYDLRQALMERKSTREFSKKPMKLSVFSDLLDQLRN